MYRIVASVVCGILITGASLAQAKKRVEVSEVVQTAYSDDNQTSFQIIARCDLDSTTAGDFEIHKLANVRVSVIKHELGYQATTRLFEVTSEGFITGRASTVPPVWTAKYIIGSKLALPTGRIILAGDQMLFVYYDGRACQFFASRKPWERIEKIDKTDSYKEMLRILYTKSYCPQDVYWDYCLVSHSREFGYNAARIDFAKFVDTKYLYQLWKDSLRDGR